MNEKKNYIAYYGTSGSSDADGIYAQAFSHAPLSLEAPRLETRVNKAGFLRLNKDASVLFATALESDGSGWVKSFRIKKGSPELELISERKAAGGGLCHLNLDRAEKWLIGASYGDAVVTVFPVDSSGILGESVFSLRLEGDGSGVNPERQEGPHAHSVYADPSNRFLFVCDLGMDRIYVYELDAATGSLTPAATPFVETAPGAGPRHLAFHGNGRWVYAINELNGMVTHYEWSRETGVLKPKGSVDTLPEAFSGENTTAEILVHPSNRFLYGSNRGHDSIAAYSINEADGSLSFVQRVSSGGAHPRNFTLDEEGKLLAVANRDSDNIAFFEIDADTGQIDARETIEGIPACTCVRLVSR